MRKQIRIFLAGIMVVIPFAVTAYVVWSVGTWLDSLAVLASNAVRDKPVDRVFPGAGVIGVLLAIYLVGLLTHWWVFRWTVGMLEKLLSRVPGIKTLYESTRDILQLFAGDSKQMGQVVRYRIPGTDIKLLGIQTSRAPKAVEGEAKVAVYLPMSYQLGGYTVYVSAEAVEPIDMTVEEAMKIAATAAVGTEQAGGAESPPHGKGI